MEQSLSRQTVRYVIVGAVVYGIDVGLFIILMMVIPKRHYLEANTVAKMVAAIAGFFLHKHFTFSWEQRHSIVRQIALYAAVFAFNMALSTGLVYLLVGRLALPTLPSRIFVDVVVTGAAFFASRQLVFRVSPPAAPAAPAAPASAKR